MARMTTFVLNPAGLATVLAGPEGPVARDLLRRAIRVESQAKLNASGRPGPRVQTGRLRASITHQIVRSPAGLEARIGTRVHYAPYLEFGTDRARPYPFLRPALRVAAE